MEQETKNGILYRPLLAKETAVLEQMLYTAIYQPPGAPLLPQDVIYQPELYCYIENFYLQAGDFCLVAQDAAGGKIVGAAWARFWQNGLKGFGFLAPQTPELALAVEKIWQNRKIGTTLLQKMIKYLRRQNIHSVSLSVDESNPAAAC